MERQGGNVKLMMKGGHRFAQCRMYINNFQDKGKQTVIDVLLVSNAVRPKGSVTT